MTCYYALHNILLEIVVLTAESIVLYCIVLSCLVLFVCSVSLYDKFQVQLSYDKIMDLRNNICMYEDHIQWCHFTPPAIWRSGLDRRHEIRTQ